MYSSLAGCGNSAATPATFAGVASSRRGAARTPAEIVDNEPRGPGDGMPRACVLNADNVASLPKGYLGELVTALSPGRLAEVCHALDLADGR